MFGTKPDSPHTDAAQSCWRMESLVKLDRPNFRVITEKVTEAKVKKSRYSN